MFVREEARQVASAERSRLEGLDRAQLLTLPSWEYQRKTVEHPGGNTYVVAHRAGLDNSDPESDLLIRVRVSAPGLAGRWKRVIENFCMDRDGATR